MEAFSLVVYSKQHQEFRHLIFAIMRLPGLLVIGSLNPNKTRGFDGISNFMLKLCASSISKPLPLFFKQSLEKECFPNEWKKAI